MFKSVAETNLGAIVAKASPSQSLVWRDIPKRGRLSRFQILAMNIASDSSSTF